MTSDPITLFFQLSISCITISDLKKYMILTMSLPCLNFQLFTMYRINAKPLNMVQTCMLLPYLYLSSSHITCQTVLEFAMSCMPLVLCSSWSPLYDFLLFGLMLEDFLFLKSNSNFVFSVKLSLVSSSPKPRIEPNALLYCACITVGSYC